MAQVFKDRIKETSTTTGTGALTLAGALTGFKTFASVCSTGDTVRYAIQAVDAFGAPTGEWEVGFGTYSGANTLTRTTVFDSSNAGSAVNFTAGTKQVWIGLDATMGSWIRERLFADRTYYVRSDGADTNNGLDNTSGGAFLTIQKALDVAGTLDAATHQVTIQIGDGTYSGTTNRCPVMQGTKSLIIRGNNTTPANVHVNTTGNCFYVDQAAAAAQVLDMKLTSGGNCLLASPAGKIEHGNVVFGVATARHINAAYDGNITAISSYAITGGALSHILSSGGSVVSSGLTMTITGTPAFSSAFAVANRRGLAVILGNTYSGSATGKRYDITANSIIDTSGASTTALPGDASGTTATGGQYV